MIVNKVTGDIKCKSEYVCYCDIMRLWSMMYLPAVREKTHKSRADHQPTYAYTCQCDSREITS